MLEPKIPYRERKYCNECYYELKPHVSSIKIIDNDTRMFEIDFWYCPDCGLMYYFENKKIIFNKKN